MATDAALRSVSRGRDFASVTGTGEVALDNAVAYQEAMSAAEAELAAKGFTNYMLDVRVLPTGGTIYGYPPVPQASQSGQTD